jgi:hypothetical protein
MGGKRGIDSRFRSMRGGERERAQRLLSFFGVSQEVGFLFI